MPSKKVYTDLATTGTLDFTGSSKVIKISGTQAIEVDTSYNMLVGPSGMAVSNATTNRCYVSIRGRGTGSANAGAIQLQNNDANGTPAITIGVLEYCNITNTSATTQRSAYISAHTEGATSADRGAYLVFATKANGSGAGAIERFRITADGYLQGDFDNGTASSRNCFQTRTINAGSYLTTVPNGTGNESGFTFFGSSSTTNTSFGGFYVNSDSSTGFVNLFSAKTGTGTLQPFTFSINVEAMRISTNRNLLIGITSEVSGGGCLQLKSGISFPATQVASSDANTLDDYEEGSYTPTIVFGVGATGVTYGTQAGYYTKIGNKVTVWGRIILTNNGSSSGVFTIIMPFTCNASAYGYGTIGYYSGLSGITGSLIGYIQPSTTSYIVCMGGATAVSNITETNVTDTADVIFCCSYFV